MGAAEKPHQQQQIANFDLHLFHHGHGHEGQRKELRDVPKGFLGVIVGQGEERQRFVIPVMHVNHPLFGSLLKEAEDEFGFDQKGPISIPCHVDEFRSIQDLINRDHSRQHHHCIPLPCLPQFGCFRV